MDSALRGMGRRPVCARDRHARPRAQSVEVDDPRGIADAVGADEFCRLGMGSVLRDLPRPDLSRADRDGDGGTRTQVWYPRPRRYFAHVRTYAFRFGGNDRKLTARGRPRTD